MGETLTKIAAKIRNAKHKTTARPATEKDVKVQLIYAFNGTGKTRLSREFKSLVAPKKGSDAEEELGFADKNIIYYNAFTEDLFYWDNDLKYNTEPKLKIQPNLFTKWVFEEQGQDRNIINVFQHYTNKNLTPHFNQQFSEITFSYERGNDDDKQNIKISKGEESCFIWSIFYSSLKLIIDVLNVAEESERETNQFNSLEYVFIDDPVSSLDENHLIELAVDLSELIKASESNLKFIITTHNPLFYNVLHNEFKRGLCKKFVLIKNEYDDYELSPQNNDSPFSYHLFLMKEIETAIASEQVQKYHFNFMRNILEKTSTFLGYENWGKLLPKTEDGQSKPYESRIINISSHSKHSGEEITQITDNDKNVLGYLLKYLKTNYKFYQ